MHQHYQINGKGSADFSEVRTLLQDFRIMLRILQILNNFYLTAIAGSWNHVNWLHFTNFC